MVSPACRVEGRVVDSVLSPGVVVEEGAIVRASVVLHDAVIRSGARLERAIVDAGAEVGPGVTVRSDDPEKPTAVVGATDGDEDDDEILSDGDV